MIFETEGGNVFFLSSDYKYLCSKSINQRNKSNIIFKRVKDEVARSYLTRGIQQKQVIGESGFNKGVCYKIYKLREQRGMKDWYQVVKLEEEGLAFFDRLGKRIGVLDDSPRRILVSEMYFISEK